MGNSLLLCKRKWSVTWFKIGGLSKMRLNQLEPIIPLKANKDVLRKLHANFVGYMIFNLTTHSKKKLHTFAYNTNCKAKKATEIELIWIKHRCDSLLNKFIHAVFFSFFIWVFVLFVIVLALFLTVIWMCVLGLASFVEWIKKKHWPEMVFCLDDLKMPEIRRYKCGSCTSFEYAKRFNYIVVVVVFLTWFNFFSNR